MSGAASPGSPPGWYGKLPFLGDFAHRRLPPAFINAWDDWLQSVIHGSRGLLGEENWLARYLSSPVWHFCLAPGVCGDRTWFGLVMSSVDRANRHFPFTIAHGVEREGLRDLSPPSLVGWLKALEAEAIAMLDLEGSVQSVEDRLANFSPPAGLDDTRPRVAEDLSAYLDQTLHVPATEVPALLAAISQDVVNGTSRPISLWWTGADEHGNAMVVRACRGLPSTEAYTAMIGGG
jgi:type VI secretion system protein ImpM